MNRVNPVFATTLAVFSGRHQGVKPPHKVLIAVDPMEIEVQVRSADRHGPAEYRMVTADDQAMKEAVERVLSFPSVIDMIEHELLALRMQRS